VCEVYAQHAHSRSQCVVTSWHVLLAFKRAPNNHSNHVQPPLCPSALVASFATATQTGQIRALLQSPPMSWLLLLLPWSEHLSSSPESVDATTLQPSRLSLALALLSMDLDSNKVPFCPSSRARIHLRYLHRSPPLCVVTLLV
jgi:hypothetical protein